MAKETMELASAIAEYYRLVQDEAKIKKRKEEVKRKIISWLKQTGKAQIRAGELAPSSTLKKLGVSTNLAFGISYANAGWDEDKLKELVSQKIWKKIVVEKVDNNLLQAAIPRGEINPDDLLAAKKNQERVYCKEIEEEVVPPEMEV